MSGGRSRRGGARTWPGDLAVPRATVTAGTLADDGRRKEPCSRCGKPCVTFTLLRAQNGNGDEQFCRKCYDLLTSQWFTQAQRAGELDARYQTIYGLTLEEYGRRFVAQMGRCAICAKDQRVLPGHGLLVVDHDHASGAVRGLLCSNCNTGIGLLGESIPAMAAAIQYVHDGGVSR